jgi:hypothetical protein
MHWRVGKSGKSTEVLRSNVTCCHCEANYRNRYSTDQRVNENLQGRQTGKCEKEIPVCTIFRNVLLYDSK